jgi:hypothetical protein
LVRVERILKRELVQAELGLELAQVALASVLPVKKGSVVE